MGNLVEPRYIDGATRVGGPFCRAMDERANCGFAGQAENW